MIDLDRNTLLLSVIIFLSAAIVYEGLAYVSRALGEHSSVMLYALSRTRKEEI